MKMQILISKFGVADKFLGNADASGLWTSLSNKTLIHWLHIGITIKLYKLLIPGFHLCKF